MGWSITVIRSVLLILEMLLSMCAVQQQTVRWAHDVLWSIKSTKMCHVVPAISKIKMCESGNI